MRWQGIPLLALALVVGAAPRTAAADLQSVDRRIGKEPRYQSLAPQYALLVFGPEAEARIWVVRDGDVLYVDRNGDGDLTAPDERVTRYAPNDVKVRSVFDRVEMFRVGALRLKVAGQERCYPGLLLMFGKDYLSMLLEAPDWPQVVGGIGLQLSTQRSDVPIIHFDGPLVVAFHPLPEGQPPRTLRRGWSKDLAVVIGTPGLGEGTFACRPHRKLTIDAFLTATREEDMGEAAPKELKPTVEIRALLSGPEESVSRRYVLEKRC